MNPCHYHHIEHMERIRLDFVKLGYVTRRYITPKKNFARLELQKYIELQNLKSEQELSQKIMDAYPIF